MGLEHMSTLILATVLVALAIIAEVFRRMVRWDDAAIRWMRSDNARKIRAMARE
jgi:hypothetical protein